MQKQSVWLVGASQMASDYVDVLTALDQDVTIIGRGSERAGALQATTNYPVIAGGLTAFLATDPALPDAAVVAVGAEALASTTTELLETGVKRILVEKPGALTTAEIDDLQQRATAASAEVFIGYNRRAYASVRAARDLIEAEGGTTSVVFEFTEWAHRIAPMVKAPGVKERLVLANSTHVIDLAFYLGGMPAELNAQVAGGLEWHPTASVFVGSGVTDSGALFAYHANWTAPGRWGVELLTRQNRYILRPMEELQVTRLGSNSVEPVEIEDEIDHRFKPGLHEQVVAFLGGASTVRLCTLEEQGEQWRWFTRIAGYQT